MPQTKTQLQIRGKITKSLLLILSISLLCSCVFLTENSLNQTISDNNFLNRFPENQKAIIILRLNGKKGDRIYLCPQEKITSNNNDKCQPIYALNRYHILMVKPNIYYLSTPTIHRPLLTSIFSNNKNLDQEKSQEKSWAILQVQAGEMVYVGDVSYRQEGGAADEIKQDRDIKIINKKLVVVDNFEFLKNLLSGKNDKQKDKLFSNQIWEINYLSTQYSRLEGYLKKRLIKNFELKNQKKYFKKNV